MNDVNLELGALQQYWSLLQQYPSLEALVIFLFYCGLAVIVDLVVVRGLKGLTRRTSMLHDDKAVEFLHMPLCWSVVGLGAIHALHVAPVPGKGPVQDTAILGIKTIVFLLWWVQSLRAVNWFISHSKSTMDKEGKLGKDLFFLTKNIVRIVIVVTGVLWTLAIWKVNLTPLFASAGIAGIAVALAAKDSLANFFGGISIFMDKAYKIGDYIILDSGERGEVVDLGIRSTRIKTRDDVLITIPNSMLANAKIINESAPIPRFRIRVPVGVAYGSDLRQVEELLVAIAKAHPMVASAPEPRARVRQFADSSINFELLCWVGDPRQKGLAIHELLHEIYDSFNKNGVSIPFPQRDIHLYHPSNGDVTGPGV